MVHPNPEMRPSAASLIQHRALCPLGNKTKAQLRRELNAERLKNEILSRQLQEYKAEFKTISPDLATNYQNLNTDNGYKLRSTAMRVNSRQLGKKVNRSSSTTNF